MEKRLKVEGMHCKSCEILLTDLLSEIDGVVMVSANKSDGSIRIIYDNEKAIASVTKAIKKEGYRVI